MEENRSFKTELTTPLNLLALMGLVCQGMVWDNYAVPFALTIIWGLCLYFRYRIKIPQILEMLIFAAALLICIKYGGRYIYAKSISIGNALAVLQVFYLLRELSPREKLTSASSALIQTAIGSQVVIGYGFIVALATATILLPKVFFELEESGYQTREKRKFRISILSIAVIVAISLLFFAAFPRVRVTSRLGSIIAPGQMQPELETSRSIMDSATRTVFQIEGSGITYLKSYALDTFDGNKWSAGKMSYVKKRPFTQARPDSLHRKVVVRDLKLMGQALPTDAYVRTVQGNFFPSAYISDQGNVIATMIWNTTENIYEYWTDEIAPTETLSKREKNSFLQGPKQDPELLKFLDSVLGSEKNQYKQTKKLEAYLKNNFKYVMGAPDLQKDAPLKDFLLVRKEGHCERFASALAALLRMKKIPSRVAIGFYPLHKNEIGNFYNVTTADAHAWTEVFLPERGWTILDATPYAENEARKKRSIFEAVYDWFEFFWYTKIVNFSVSEQSNILGFIKNEIFGDLKKLIPRMLYILAGIFSAFLLYSKRQYLKKLIPSLKGGKRRRIQAIKNFYGDMLGELSKAGLFKETGETPYEFLLRIEEAMPEISAEARVITESFCAIRYAESDEGPESMRLIKRCFDVLKKCKKKKSTLFKGRPS